MSVPIDMIVRVDIDGTICETDGDYYEGAVAIPDNIHKINKLFDAGHTIIYWTARGAVSGIDWMDFTLKQLQGWGCKFHDLERKPAYDLHIDDKSKRIEEIP
jgi:hypothetical protein